MNVERWQDAKELRDLLAGDGWLTPDTYDRCFESPIDGPAVYALLLWEGEWMEKAMVAYVGMSSRLAQRWTAHPILTQLSQPGYWTQRWFLPTPKAELRLTESELIARFDPPWNIQGRKRGLVLQ